MRDGFNFTAVVVTVGLLCITFVATYYASRRTRTSAEFWTAGGQMTGRKNGIAIAGDFLSSASLLGYAGLAYMYGMDGVMYAVFACGIFLMVLFLIAEKLRNLGRFTFADALATRLRSGPVRIVSAISTLFICIFYLLAQLVAGGVLMEALAGIDFTWGVVIAAVLMLTYVLFGGMLATTWLQIIKAVSLMSVVALLVLLVLIRIDPNPLNIIESAVAQSSYLDEYLATGNSFGGAWNIVSMAVAVTLSAVGLPHVLMRFFTVPDAVQARSSAIWAISLIGGFNVLIAFLGIAARAALGTGGEEVAGKGGNLALPALTVWLGGGEGFAADLLLALVVAISIATLLAVASGLVLSASSAVAHDLWAKSFHRPEREEITVGRVAAVALVLITVGVTLVIGSAQNVTFLATLATATAASSNFPVLIMTMLWRRMRTLGAVVGALSGLVTSLVLIVTGPLVWPSLAPLVSDSLSTTAPFPLAFPILFSVPAGFLGCVIGSYLSREKPDELAFDEMQVRALTGAGLDTTKTLTH
ncbi:cation acetate symporter [Gordonia sp. PKS22-38]|uniref:Cation acetate symporter n=1 Tax=Gordonia prachuapensis TaxID=3115651 RepID=A0ABU7MSU1_9ACTN|nr:cation acetate symporter [Gordonia sp. PKS22-38]